RLEAAGTAADEGVRRAEAAAAVRVRAARRAEVAALSRARGARAEQRDGTSRRGRREQLERAAPGGRARERLAQFVDLAFSHSNPLLSWVKWVKRHNRCSAGDRRLLSRQRLVREGHDLVPAPGDVAFDHSVLVD